MKCDELKVYEEMEDYVGYDDYTPTEMYDKSEVDAAIDELKREHHKERHEYIDMVSQNKAKLVEQESENRRQKRALWLARADRAMMTLDYFTLKCRWFKDYMKVEPPGCDVKMISKWANISRKCRVKAEEYYK